MAPQFEQYLNTSYPGGDRECREAVLPKFSLVKQG